MSQMLMTFYDMLKYGVTLTLTQKHELKNRFFYFVIFHAYLFLDL